MSITVSEKAELDLGTEECQCGLDTGNIPHTPSCLVHAITEYQARDAIERLKKAWIADGCWDIEETDGFEDCKGELLAWRLEYEHLQALAKAPDPNGLAALMLAWHGAQERADELADEIKAVVLLYRKTQKTGLITATFNNPRKTYNYMKAVVEHENCTTELLAKYTSKPDPKIDYLKCANALGLVAAGNIPFTEGKASVTLKRKS